MVLPLAIGDLAHVDRLARIAATTRAATAGRDRGDRWLLASPLLPMTLLRVVVRWLADHLGCPALRCAISRGVALACACYRHATPPDHLYGRLGTSRSQTHIREAPTIDPDGDLSADEEARRYQHYGLHYGLVTPGAGPSGTDSAFIAPATDRVGEEAPKAPVRAAGFACAGTW